MKLDLSATPKLLDQVKHESVRYTFEHVFRMQLTTPLGWLLVLGLVWSRVPAGRTLVWTAGFAVLLGFILAKLWQLRGTQESQGNRIAWLHVLAALDGLASEACCRSSPSGSILSWTPGWSPCCVASPPSMGRPGRCCRARIGCNCSRSGCPCSSLPLSSGTGRAPSRGLQA